MHIKPLELQKNNPEVPKIKPWEPIFPSKMKIGPPDIRFEPPSMPIFIEKN